MLLHHARAAARLDDGGRPVPLAEQDRSRWDRALITEGTRVLDGALARREPGPYQLQAAIAALHAQAASVEETDWPQIALLYGSLARLDPSPVVEVNRAVAVGMADGPLAGLAVLEPVLASGLPGRVFAAARRSCRSAGKSRLSRTGPWRLDQGSGNQRQPGAARGIAPPPRKILTPAVDPGPFPRREAEPGWFGRRLRGRHWPALEA